MKSRIHCAYRIVFLLYAVAVGNVLAYSSEGIADTKHPRPFSSYDTQVKELLSRMTLEEKIGQMTQADHEFIKYPRDIERYFLGSVLSGGTTILKAIKNTASANTKITFSKDGSAASGADVGIVVIGEKPYAEGPGDVAKPVLAREDIKAVNNMKKAGIPVVVILISGRPLIINDVLKQADAFIAAWLPGTEGQGVADVLFGDYKPTGKLSFTWPRSIADIPVKMGDKNYNPLFPYGYGLTY